MTDAAQTLPRPATAPASLAAPDATADPTARPGEVGDFIVLMKPRVMRLVVFTGLVGLLAAPGGLHPVIAFTAVLCIAIGAGAAGALNMWYDADIDAEMKRTARRPLPAGSVSPSDALGFGLVLSVGSVSVMGLWVNWTAASLLALTIAFYVAVYTMWLKRRTPQNIVIGGAAGAFPPMIGWAAVTGSVSVDAMVLFGIIFFWTPPHFWALSLFVGQDYDRASVPMLPVVAGRRATRAQILAYSVLLAPLGVVPFLLGTAGALYGLVAAILGLVFVARAWAVWRADDATDVAPAKKLFGFSIVYLFALFLVLGLDVAVTRALETWT
ncbi:protoheme IX farnesyltransferase [Rhodothalassium salexigens]|uniref:heme o synthase n=1 Tax=Rhodothalassium salexigens TaxID=1086 RepID=UPI0019127885|nr:heme o synthase [Rhodothalassium salexigens]MBK5912470.1 protoheme IX farnesyltransferase [Rhodothalassium salexigens]MBK5920651.1 protoheme IX farnesyltransferase [Rhodothalassium salexigens]